MADPTDKIAAALHAELKDIDSGDITISLHEDHAVATCWLLDEKTLVKELRVEYDDPDKFPDFFIDTIRQWHKLLTSGEYYQGRKSAQMDITGHFVPLEPLLNGELDINTRELIKQRIEATGDNSPGQWNFVADILQIVGNEAQGWTNREDDATRIPQVIYELSDYCRQKG